MEEEIDKGMINPPQEEKEDENELIVTLSYCNKEIQKFHLPFFLDDFKSQFLSAYNINSPKILNEMISLFYVYQKEEGEKETVEVRSSDDYTLMISRVKDSKLPEGKKVVVETSRYPPGVGREEPKDFEDEIKTVVERELRVAEENIKKSLIGKKFCGESIKRQKNKCFKCKENIIGDMYKEVTKDEDNFCCGKCASQITTPLFIIH